MNSEDNTPIAPWYRQPWLWFILAPIIAVVIYGTSFLYLSIITHDGIVKDDMYKVARGHFVDKSHSEAAKALGVSGTLELDNATGDLMIHFRSNQTEKPKHLTLSIVHPTHQQYDQNIMLKQVPSTNSYTGSLQTSLKGKRYLILEDDSASWNLRAEIHPPYDQNSIELEPAHN
ncbi:FixH family protein [Neptuniibacter marinus]|uniref:FixH family protein n=1 Tax=Neptuniibacter marinus TaxID=1806670 RepID=UPI003B58DC31